MIKRLLGILLAISIFSIISTIVFGLDFDKALVFSWLSILTLHISTLNENDQVLAKHINNIEKK